MLSSGAKRYGNYRGGASSANFEVNNISGFEVKARSIIGLGDADGLYSAQKTSAGFFVGGKVDKSSKFRLFIDTDFDNYYSILDCVPKIHHGSADPTPCAYTRVKPQDGIISRLQVALCT